MAACNNLEHEAVSRTEKLTHELAQFHELGELWERFGIVGDIVVSIHYLFTQVKHLLRRSTAIHCRYTAR